MLLNESALESFLSSIRSHPSKDHLKQATRVREVLLDKHFWHKITQFGAKGQTLIEEGNMSA